MKSSLFGLGILLFALTGCAFFSPEKPCVSGKLGYDLPIVDLDQCSDIQVTVDKEKGQYLGHPTTYLCADGKTILCVYPKGHGRGPVVYKKSFDGGKTWSERLPTPASWNTSREVPTLYGITDSTGHRRVIMFSGIMVSGTEHKNRCAFSEDEGQTWSELKNIPNQPAGIVVMADLIALNTGKGHYMATYHNNTSGTDSAGRYGSLELYTVKTDDAGESWSDPEIIFPGTRTKHLCEGGFVRSPDGSEIALLLRENSRHFNSQIMFSADEGKTWSQPVSLPGSLSGDRHQALPLPDGRLLIQFRDHSPIRDTNHAQSPTEGDWVGWVGTWDDLKNGHEGEYRIRFKDNRNGWDTAYPAAEYLPDGTIVCTTYGHFTEGESPYILSERFKIAMTDELANEIRRTGRQPAISNSKGGKSVFIFDPNNPEAIQKVLKKK